MRSRLTPEDCMTWNSLFMASVRNANSTPRNRPSGSTSRR